MFDAPVPVCQKVVEKGGQPAVSAGVRLLRSRGFLGFQLVNPRQGLVPEGRRRPRDRELSGPLHLRDATVERRDQFMQPPHGPPMDGLRSAGHTVDRRRDWSVV
jgi:hypothetical protein